MPSVSASKTVALPGTVPQGRQDDFVATEQFSRIEDRKQQLAGDNMRAAGELRTAQIQSCLVHHLLRGQVQRMACASAVPGHAIGLVR
jgi:hypothetical protein